MRFFILVAVMSYCFSVNAEGNLSCNRHNIPTVVKPIENWEIIATNVARINTATYFNGKNLLYFVSYSKINSSNKISINQANGKIKIQAEKQDNFNLRVTAKNSCGVASTTFNVQIDEEE